MLIARRPLSEGEEVQLTGGLGNALFAFSPSSELTSPPALVMSCNVPTISRVGASYGMFSLFVMPVMLNARKRRCKTLKGFKRGECRDGPVADVQKAAHSTALRTLQSHAMSRGDRLSSGGRWCI